MFRFRIWRLAIYWMPPTKLARFWFAVGWETSPTTITWII